MIESSTTPGGSEELMLGATPRNPAVARCHKAWLQTFSISLEKYEGVALAYVFASEAYCDALPLLDSHKHIADFITCVGYAMANGVIIHELSTYLLSIAKVALSVAGPRPGRPTKKGKSASRKMTINTSKSYPKPLVSNHLAA